MSKIPSDVEIKVALQPVEGEIANSISENNVDLA